MKAGYLKGTFRTRDRQEVDLVIETTSGSVAAIEVKASGTVADHDFAGLRLLRDKLGSAFVGGTVVNRGQETPSMAMNRQKVRSASFGAPATARDTRLQPREVTARKTNESTQSRWLGPQVGV